MLTALTALAAGTSVEDAVDIVAAGLDDAGLYFGHGCLDAEEEAAWLVLFAAKMPLDTEPDWSQSLDRSQVDAIKLLGERRITTRQPLAYLTGEAWFAGLPFHVDERVLVPRSFMAEWIPDAFAPWVEPGRVHRILDLCCGSGCIGIAAAFAFPEAKVVLSDVSRDALEVARSNVLRHDLGDRVEVVQSDGLKSVAGHFDLILCNPPYVTEASMRELPPEFRHEPALGLVSGPTGLDFIERLLSDAASALTNHGNLIVEAGTAGPAVEARWPGVPFSWLGTTFDEMALFLLDRETLVAHRTAFTN